MKVQKTILHLNLHRQFFAQIAAGTKRVEQGEPVTAPGVPKHYPDAQKLVTEDCIRPQAFRLVR